MRFDTFTVVMAVLLGTVLMLAVRTLRRRDFFLRTFGVHTVLFLYLLCVLRMALPVEFPFTIPVGVPAWESLAAMLNTPLPRIGWNVERLLTAVWLTGAAVLLLVFGLREIRLSRYLRRYPGRQNALAETILDNIRQFSPRRFPVQVRVYQGLDMPVGVGLLRPLICLPDRDYTATELTYILRHEYTHFLGRDLQIKFLARLYVCLFWWNPAAWLLLADLGQVLELRCDQAVTRDFTMRERREYLTVILRSIMETENRKLPGPSSISTSLSVSRARPDMLERFQMVADPEAVPSQRHSMMIAAGSALLFAGSYAFLFQPTAAANRFTLPDGMMEALLLLAVGGGMAAWALRQSKRAVRLSQCRLGALATAAAVLVTGLGVYQMGFQAGRSHAPVTATVTNWDGSRSNRIAINAEHFDSLTALDVHDVLCTSVALGVSPEGPCQYHFDLVDSESSRSEYFLKDADTTISAANCMEALRAVAADAVVYEPGMSPEFLSGDLPLCGISGRYAQLTGLELGGYVTIPIYTVTSYSYGNVYHFVGLHTLRIAAIYPSDRVKGHHAPDMIVPADWLRFTTETWGVSFYYSSLSVTLDDRQVEQVWDAGFVPAGTEGNRYLSNNTVAILT